MEYYKNLDRQQIKEACPSCKNRDSLRYYIKDIYSPGYVRCNNSSCRAKIIFDSSYKMKLQRAVKELEDQESEYLELLQNKFKSYKIEK